MAWDSDELNRIHNLHVREFKDIAVGAAGGTRSCTHRRTRMASLPLCLPSCPSCSSNSTQQQLIAQERILLVCQASFSSSSPAPAQNVQ